MNIKPLLLSAICNMSTLVLSDASDPSASLEHTVVTFELKMAAPIAEVAPLFGAEKERAWAGSHWNPIFLYPQPARDTKGAVFAVSHGDVEAIWVCTELDLAAGRIQYVYTIPKELVTLIEIELKETGKNRTVGHVSYQRTALAAEGNDRLRHLADADRKAGPEWEHAINNYLKTRSSQ
ncbi:MAG TPA: hypothetical protein VGH00_09280 [Chthoniobacterales bacterium]